MFVCFLRVHTSVFCRESGSLCRLFLHSSDPLTRPLDFLVTDRVKFSASFCVALLFSPYLAPWRAVTLCTLPLLWRWTPHPMGEIHHLFLSHPASSLPFSTVLVSRYNWDYYPALCADGLWCRTVWECILTGQFWAHQTFQIFQAHGESNNNNPIKSLGALPQHNDTIKSNFHLPSTIFLLCIMHTVCSHL